MLFKKKILYLIASGKLTVAYRRWVRPTVKEGGSLKTPIGVLSISSVKEVKPSSVSEKAARLAGYESLKELRDELDQKDSGVVYKIKFKFSGTDPRVLLREKGNFSKEEWLKLKDQLERYDKYSKSTPWTLTTLKLIQKYPETPAKTLAKKMNLDTKKFKINVRKLKNLGLTISMGTGYKLSKRGWSFLKKVY